MAESARDPPSAAEDTLDEMLRDKARITEISSDSDSDSDDSDDDGEELNDQPKGTFEVDGPPFPGKHLLYPKTHAPRQLPLWLQPETFNLFHDDLDTATSEAQNKTFAECLQMLTGKDTQRMPLNSHGLPHLRRWHHKGFLHSTLVSLPAPYVVADASRPWFFYWALAGLSFLDEDISDYRQRLIETVRPLQNKTGGFGGGDGHYSHCAATYATTLALAQVKALEVIDRKTMWEWLGTVKQTDGGFRMAVNAEEDVRGAYCAMTIITLLNLPLELPPDAAARQAGMTSFTDRLGEWVGRCQTYEGGVGAAPGNEAHGAYAFCALACLTLLDAPNKSIQEYLNVPALLSCLAGLQTSHEGGFAGRTNKLVDACYSHWVGSCWALLEAAANPHTTKGESNGTSATTADLWSREGLIRYLLTCCQQPGKRGGMRDKPSARPDGYHTCYSLAGLSAAQNHYSYDVDAETVADSGRLMAAFNWSATGPSEEEKKIGAFDEADRVAFVHPVFVITFDAVEDAKVKFAKAGI